MSSNPGSAACLALESLPSVLESQPPHSWDRGNHINVTVRMKWESGIHLANGNHYHYSYLIVSFFSTLQMFAGHFFSPYRCLHIIFHKFSKCWFLGLPSLWYQLCMHCCLSLGLYFSAVFTICREHPQASSHLIFDLCHSTRKAGIVEDETTMYRGLEQESPQGLLTSVWALSPIPHRPWQYHSCLICFSETYIFFIMC